MKTSPTSPAVSQLAGEIVDEFRTHLGLDLAIREIELDDLKAIISAALSEREEKVAKLIEAVKDDICSVKCGPMCCDKLRAALSALGESKG